MTKELENSIKNKSFEQLSKHELDALKEANINKEDFLAMKAFYLNLELNTKQPKVDKDIKSRLDLLFDTTHGAETKSVWQKFAYYFYSNGKINFSAPIIQFAALALLITIGVTIFNTNKSVDRNLAQYTPKKLDALTAEKHDEQTENEKVNVFTQNEDLNNTKSSNVKVKELNSKNNNPTTSLLKEKQDFTQNTQLFELKSKKNRISGSTNFDVAPQNKVNNSRMEIEKADLLPIEAEIAEDLDLEEISIAETKVAVPSVKANASASNYLMLDVLTPLF